MVEKCLDWICFLEIIKDTLLGKNYAPTKDISAEQWGQIIHLAQIHQLLPVVVNACYQLPGLAETPLLIAVRGNVRQQVFTQTRKTSEFLSLYQKLRVAGVKPLVVKGIVCRNLYPQPDQRLSSDEDILIPAEQFERCHEVMTAFGMERKDTPAPEDSYEIPYTKVGSPLYIELHKSLFPPESDAYGELNGFFEGVFERAVEETIEGTAILTLAPTDHLFYLICHAFKHFLHGGFGIRQVCDIVLYARRYGGGIDWDRVLRNCESIRADRFAAALLAIGEKYLGVTVFLPENWQWDVDEMPMLEDLLASGIYGGADMERKHSSNITLNAVTRQKQGKDTGGGVLKSLFPGRKDMEGRYPYLKKYPVLLPVAWASRICRFAVKNAGTDMGAKTVRLGNERIELLKYYGVLDS